MKKHYLALPLLLLSMFCNAQSSVKKDSITVLSKSIADSGHLSTTVIVPKVKLFPNPATNKITLQVNGFSAGMITVKIIDIRGKLQRNDNRLLASGNEDVPMFLMIPQGIYYVLISQNGKLAKTKLVLQ